MPDNIKLTLSLVVYKNRINDIDKIISEVKKIIIPFHFYIFDNSPVKLIDEDMSDENVTFIHSKSNIGFGRGHNVCLKLAEKVNPYAHLFINPDVQFSADTVERLYRFVTENEDAGLVTPAVYYPDGSFQYVCRTLPRFYELTVRLLSPVLPKGLVEKVNKEHEMHHLDYSKTQIVPMVNGCFFMVNFEILKEVGYYDERFFLYFEDVDLCRRFGSVSRIVYFPEVSVVHVHTRESRKNLKFTFIHILSAFKYFMKWFGRGS